MFEYAFLRPRAAGVTNAAEIHQFIEKQLPGLIESVNFSGHTEPFVIFLRCNRSLTQDEYKLIELALREEDLSS